MAFVPLASAEDATDLNTLFGSAYDLVKAHKYAEALPYAERARELTVAERFGSAHEGYERAQVLLAQIHSGLSTKLHDAGKYAEAEEHAKTTLAIQEAMLGKTHPKVATSLTNLVVIYKAQGRYDLADPLYKRALAILAARPADTAIRPLIENARYPWKAVGRLNYQGYGYCTGVLVAPDIVLTAAHCLYNWRTRRWAVARRIHFVAGYRGEKYLFHAHALSYRRAEGFEPLLDRPTRRGVRANHQNTGQDWAVIKLDKSASTRIGYLGLAKVTRNFRLPSTPTFMLAGYGRDRPYALAGDRACRLLNWDARGPMLRHNCRTDSGISGAPIIGAHDGRYYVYAIHVAVDRKSVINSSAVPSAAFFDAVRKATGHDQKTLDDGLIVMYGKAGS